jgi:hypothetical protein
VGIVLLLVSLVVGEHLHGIFDALGGGDWFTGSSLAAFLGALGFGGAIVEQLTGNVALSVVGGLCSDSASAPSSPTGCTGCASWTPVAP